MGNFINWFERSYKGIIVALVAVMAAALVVLAMQHVDASSANAGGSPRPIPTFDSSDPAVVVSILSDSHAYNANSWWRQTVVAGNVPGVTLGQFDSTPGADSARLADDAADSASKGGWVIVQAGTNDLAAGRTPEEAADGIRSLWTAVTEAGAKPIAALVPPSDERPASVVELNKLIADAAEEEDLPLLDVYTDVAASDGSWADGHSGDGRHADETASKTMAAAARTQLPTLIAD